MAYSQTVVYDTASMLIFDATKLNVTAGALSLKNNTGYSTANPLVQSQYQFPMTVFSTFTESSSVSGSDAIKYQLVVNGTAYWWNASLSPAAWAVADGTYATSNPVATINANLSTLVATLGLSRPFFLGLNIFLHSATGSSTPTLTNNGFTYTYANGASTALNQSTIFCYLADLLAQVPTYNAAKPYTLYVKNDRAFFHGNNFILPFTKSASFNSAGYAQLSCIETATPGEMLDFFISYYENSSRKSVKLFSAVVPNVASQSLSAVTTVADLDFG